MVVALGPGRFYGSGLPRPRFFQDPKFNSHRVDPPLSVTDPLLTWAREAHWSMGGLNSKRLRLQGRIEGSLAKLRGRRRGRQARKGPTTKAPKTRLAGQKPEASLDALDSDEETSEEEEELIVEEAEEEEEEEDQEEEVEKEPVVVVVKRKRARKLGDEFDRIALAQQQEKELHVGIGRRTRSKSASPVDVTKNGGMQKGKKKKKKKKAVAAASRWTSPRRKSLA